LVSLPRGWKGLNANPNQLGLRKCRSQPVVPTVISGAPKTTLGLGFSLGYCPSYAANTQKMGGPVDIMPMTGAMIPDSWKGYYSLLTIIRDA